MDVINETFNGHQLYITLLAAYVVVLLSTNYIAEGDYAEGEIYVLAFHQVRKEDGGKLDLLIGGRYFDRYEKRDGTWREIAIALPGSGHTVRARQGYRAPGGD